MATLSISAYTALAANVNFTTLTVGGKSDDDWQVWKTLSTREQKSGGTGAISNYSTAGGAGVDSFDGGATAGRVISWTDGTPTGSGSDASGIRQNSFNTTDDRGFSFTVSGVGTGEQTLRVVVGRYSDLATANAFKIVASISDASTGTQTSTLIGKTSDEDGYYDITMAAASAGQTVTVTWQSNTLGSNLFRACNLRGAWLSTPTASDISGTSATTNANDAPSAAGTTTVTGTNTTTNANDSTAISGTTTVLGASSTTNASDTSAASGTSTVPGASSTTNSDDAATASGSVGSAVSGDSATTNADDAAAAQGTTELLGTSATTNINDSCTATGVAGAVSGTADVTNNNDSSNANGATPNSQQNSGGYANSFESWNPVYLVNRKRRELQKTDIPKVAKKAIQEVAKLNLSNNEAEIALRLRTQQIQWQAEYLSYLQGLQDAQQALIAHENEQLNSRLRTAAFQASYQAKIASELEDRQRRIQLIMQLI